MTSKIDPTKQYRIRDGLEWRFLEFRGVGDEEMLVGAVRSSNGGWDFCTHFPSGRASKARDTPLDLIEVRPRIRRKVWINVNPWGHTVHADHALANTAAAGERIACLEVTLDYEEGQGL